MKATLLSLLFLANISLSFGQVTAGLIAHWDMDSTTNDVSGSGHNGTGHNLTPAVGMDGVAGHAWYFNGVNSYITIPYSPALNISGFTIATVIKVEGYYTNPCHANMVFCRGTTGGTGTGTYQMEFTDFPAGYGCSSTTVDTSQESFTIAACATGTSLAPSSFTGFNAPPYILENQWYTAIATFNDTVFNVYINGTLMVSVPSPTPGVPMGVSTDSASIGYCIYDASAGYPYGFKGIMDDLKFYNRALSDSEIVHINDTCGHITSQPVMESIVSGGTATYRVNASIVGATYQWQQDAGTGFIDLTNSGPYSGVYTPTLTITAVTSAMSSYHYRCLVSNSWGCADTTVSALLTLGIGGIQLNDAISVYPNPATNTFTVLLYGNDPQGAIQLFSEIGQFISEKDISGKTNTVDISSLPAGIYILKVECNGQVAYRKVTKY